MYFYTYLGILVAVFGCVNMKMCKVSQSKSNSYTYSMKECEKGCCDKKYSQQYKFCCDPNPLVGAIVGGVLGFLAVAGVVLFFVIYCCCCKNKNRSCCGCCKSTSQLNKTPGNSVMPQQPGNALPPGYNPSPGFAPQQGYGMQQQGFSQGPPAYGDPYAPPPATYNDNSEESNFKTGFTYS